MRVVAGHTFVDEWPLCIHCGASLSGALCDEAGRTTSDGGRFTRECPAAPAPVSPRWLTRLRRLRRITL